MLTRSSKAARRLPGVYQEAVRWQQKLSDGARRPADPKAEVITWSSDFGLDLCPKENSGET